jgi:tetratricopeptide (TPR) repeat protein
MAVGEVGGIEGRTRAIMSNPELAFLSRRAPLYVIAAEVGQGRVERALESADEIVLRGGDATYAPIAIGVSDVRFWLLDDSVGAVDALQEALRTRFDEVAVQLRPWDEAVALFALAGRVDLAAGLLESWETETTGVRQPNVVSHQNVSRAMIDAGEGRYAIALEQLEATVRDMGCPRCFELQRAVVLEELRRFGEAIAIWETVRDYPTRILEPGFERAIALRRLGPLHEQAGDTAAAITAYQKFAEAWADADAVLQPQVTHARERIAALGG